MDRILLIGGGGHCKVIIDAIRAAGTYEIAGIIDTPDNIGREVLGIPIVGDDSQLGRRFSREVRTAFISTGNTGYPSLRLRLHRLARAAGYIFPNIIHPTATVSTTCALGEGIFIAAGAIVGPVVSIGDHCIINTGSRIDHDCVLGNFVHIAPGVSLSGNVSIGDHTLMGIGSVAIQNVRIGRDTVIGAGSTVVKDIREGYIAYGSPCEEIKSINKSQ